MFTTSLPHHCKRPFHISCYRFFYDVSENGALVPLNIFCLNTDMDKRKNDYICKVIGNSYHIWNFQWAENSCILVLSGLQSYWRLWFVNKNVILTSIWTRQRLVSEFGDITHIGQNLFSLLFYGKMELLRDSTNTAVFWSSERSGNTSCILATVYCIGYSYLPVFYCEMNNTWMKPLNTDLNGYHISLDLSR